METKLFSTFSFKNVTFKNRITMSPMCMYSAKQDGFVTPFHVTHYASRAIGQVGSIMIEATAVVREGRISENDLGIWCDEHIEGLRMITNEIARYGSVSGIQLAHAGRKSMTNGTIYAPSALAFNHDMKTPEEMTESMIDETILDFQKAATRAKKAGFDIIEIHAAHGYLINEFLSPLTNKRTDKYGGTLKERYRFLHETIDAVRQVWNGPLFVRISAKEYADGGNTLNDFIHISEWMKEQGVDLIDISSGGIVSTPVFSYPGYQVPLSEKIKSNVQIPTSTVGMITTGNQAEEILQNRRADLIFIGRELLRDPYWPLRAAQQLNFKISTPEAYERGWNV